MTSFRGRALHELLIIAAVACMPAPAPAETYPARPIRMLVGFAPGGTADVVARIIAQPMSESLGQQVFIENKAGAGGTIAHALAAQSSPDGYTYVMATNSTFAIAPHLYTSLPYDQDKALAPVALVTSSAMALCVHSTVPARSVAELIALATAKPQQLNFASAGLGATSHLATELFMAMAGLRMSHVPYRSGSQAVQAVVAGDVHITFVDLHVAQSLMGAGHVRVLGVSSLVRHALVPDLPTVSESGLSGFEMATTTGLFAPRGVEPSILQRMEKEIMTALQQARVREQYRGLSFEVLAKGRAELDAHVQEESQKWGKIIRERGIKLTQ